MVSKELRDQMTRYLIGSLEQSGLYDIESAKDGAIIVSESACGCAGDEQKYAILTLFGRPQTAGDVILADSNLRRSKIPTVPVFLKDGETYMVRLGRRAHIKGNGRSLDDYTKEQRDAMIHLRELEGHFHNRQPSAPVVYYQPETANLEESLRIFKFNPVLLNYSHITGERREFTGGQRFSVDYKIPVELEKIAGPIGVRLAGNGLARIVQHLEVSDVYDDS